MCVAMEAYHVSKKGSHGTDLLPSSTSSIDILAPCQPREYTLHNYTREGGGGGIICSDCKNFKLEQKELP